MGEPAKLIFLETSGRFINLSEIIDSGFLNELSEASLPQPRPKEIFIFL